MKSFAKNIVCASKADGLIPRPRQSFGLQAVLMLDSATDDHIWAVQLHCREAALI